MPGLNLDWDTACPGWIPLLSPSRQILRYYLRLCHISVLLNRFKIYFTVSCDHSTPCVLQASWNWCYVLAHLISEFRPLSCVAWKFSYLLFCAPYWPFSFYGTTLHTNDYIWIIVYLLSNSHPYCSLTEVSSFGELWDISALRIWEVLVRMSTKGPVVLEPRLSCTVILWFSIM